MLSRTSPFRPSAAFIALPLALTLAGCAGFSTTASSPAVTASGSMSGSVHGGQQPITGSHVHLYEFGSGGYGTASTDDITDGATGVAIDNYGHYVTTDARGNFTLTQYTCQNASNQTYLLATEGNPGYTGTGVDNVAISLLAATGTCGSLASLNNVNINEISTVATITALQPYYRNLNKISSNSSAASKAALVNSASLVSDLNNVTTGTATTVNKAGTGVTPQAKIDSLANSIAPCVNAQTNGDAACTSLFAAATPPGGAAPTDIATAVYQIAQHPTLQATNIYNLATAAAPFAPALTKAPADWALPIALSATSITSPQNVAIDASGNAWITNCPSCAGAAGTDSIVEISPAGAVLGTTTTGIHMPTGLAIDNSGNVWSTDLASGSFPDQIVKQTGTSIDFTFSDSTISSPQGIAIDLNNNAWVTNQNTSSIVQILSGGTRTLAAVTRSGFNFPTGIGIDANGFIFAAGTGSNNILKLTPAGAYSTTYTGSGLNQPIGISFDGADNFYTVDNNSSALSILSGNNGTGTSGFVGVSNAEVVAIDGLSTAWIANSTSNGGNILHASSTATGIGASSGLQDASLVGTSADAIDASGNIWVTNPGSGKVTLFVGVAAPVVTPIAAGTLNNTLGARP